MALNQRIIETLDNELTPQSLPRKPPYPLFHYTGAEGFRGIVTDKAIRATDFRFLNDAAEIAAGERVVFEEAQALSRDKSLPDDGRWLLEQFVSRHDGEKLSKKTDIFIASFSERGNQLSQWRGYASQGVGYSLGFAELWTPGPSVAAGERGLALVPCDYGGASIRAEAVTRYRALAERFAAEVKKHATTKAERDGLADCLFVPLLFRHAGLLELEVKDPAFEDEREWRLVSLTDPSSPEAAGVQCRPSVEKGLVPYIEVPLTENKTPPKLRSCGSALALLSHGTDPSRPQRLSC